MIEKLFTSISVTRIAWMVILIMTLLHVLTSSPMHAAIIAAFFTLIIYAIGRHIASVRRQQRKAQPDTANGEYLAQRVETLMKNRRVFRTTSPDCNIRFTIMKDVDESKKTTYRIAFTEEEFLRAGETNGNINTRTETFYLITPAKRGVVVGTSVSQVYANNDTEGNAVPTYTQLDHLPYGDFARIESALMWS